MPYPIGCTSGIVLLLSSLEVFFQSALSAPARLGQILSLEDSGMDSAVSHCLCLGTVTPKHGDNLKVVYWL